MKKATIKILDESETTLLSGRKFRESVTMQTRSGLQLFVMAGSTQAAFRRLWKMSVIGDYFIMPGGRYIKSWTWIGNFESAAPPDAEKGKP
jgi:hypothetical protein